MLDFITAIKNVLEEQEKTTQNLFEDKIISENTFYKYKQRCPSLKTLIKILNYLEISIDYFFDSDVENNFIPYEYNPEIFYNNIKTILNSRKISGRQFCKDLNYAKDNLLRWKKGIYPSVQCLIEISRYLNCSINDLLLE